MHKSKPTLPVRSKETEKEYNTTKKYLKLWGYKIGTFADWLGSQPKLSPATQAKHLRQAKTIAADSGKHWNLGTPPHLVQKAPPKFTDDDFKALYNAFNKVKYPSFILPEFRPLYWQTLIHLASITALRREAILGLQLQEINFDELYIHVIPETDKKGKNRYKPITSELAADILDLIRHYDKSQIHPAQHNLVFPWKHGNKQWYSCWQKAEAAIGKRFHLHDLKRFSGELALRAGATPLELQQHMDHQRIETTLNHYVRPQTTGLVKKMRVPIPDREQRHTPMFGEGEILNIVQEIIHDKLSELGIVGHHVALDKFGIPTNIHHDEIRESEQRTQQARRKKKKENVHTFHLYLPKFDILVEEGGCDD